MVKRKRNITVLDSPKPRKRHAHHPHGAIDYEREYKLRTILDETDTKYLIAWEDDEVTGEAYKNTWEPKANANELAVRGWEEVKAARTSRAAEENAVLPEKTPVQRKRARRKNVVESSSPQSSQGAASITRRQSKLRERVAASSSPLPVPASSPPINSLRLDPVSQSTASGTAQILEIDESDTDNRHSVDEDYSQPISERRLAQVQLGQPPSSYLAGAYEKISQEAEFAARQPSLPEEYCSPSPGHHQQITVKDESQYSTGVQSQFASLGSNRDAVLVIPDSQSQQIDQQQKRQPDLPLDQDAQDKKLDKGHQYESPSTGLETAANLDLRSQPSPLSRPGLDAQSPVTVVDPPSPALSPRLDSQVVALLNSLPDEQQGEISSPAPEVALPQHETEQVDYQSNSPGITEHVTNFDTAILSSVKADQSHVAEAEQDASVSDIVLSCNSTRSSEPSEEAKNIQADSRSTGSYPSTPQAESLSERDFESEEDSQSEQDSQAEQDSQSQARSASQQYSQSKQDSQSAHESTQESASSESRRTQLPVAVGAQQQPIVISSHEDQEPSSLGSLGTTQLSRAPNYEPPPPGQKPGYSSAIQQDSPVKETRPQPSANANCSSNLSLHWPPDPRKGAADLQRQSSYLYASTSQSSFPFQTQIRPTISGPATANVEEQRRRDNWRATTDSSPFPSIPSHSLSILGATAPSPLANLDDNVDATDAHVAMESTHEPKRSAPEPYKDTPNHLRPIDEQSLLLQPASSLPPSISAEVTAAQRAARLSVPPEAVRSPSTVPAVLPIVEVSKEEQNTSERYETLLPQAQASSSNAEAFQSNGSSSNVTSSSKAAADSHPDPEGANVHVVPIGLFGIQRDSYLQSMWLHNDTIQTILEEHDPSEDLLQQADALFHRLRCITMHPDLINPEALTQVSQAERQAQWDCDASAKFRFLKEFLERQSHRGIHVALVVRGRVVAEMLQTFLEGIHISYKTSYRSSSPRSEEDIQGSGPRVTVVDLEQDVDKIESADVVIAIDGLIFYQDAIIRAYRQHETQPELEMSQVNHWASLYILVAPRTIEHIERSMVPSLSRKARVRALVTAIDRFREYFSRKEEGKYQLLLLKQAAQDVVAYLDVPGYDWPLDDLPTIEGLDSQTDTDMVSGQEDHSVGGQEHNNGKRALGSPEAERDSDDAAKRARLYSDATSAPATFNPQDFEITHVSDTTGKGTQGDDMASAAESSDVERQLREALEYQQNRLEEHVKALEELQFRHEAGRVERVEIERYRDQAIDSATTMLKRMNVVEQDNTALRTERTQLKTQLEEANRRLLDHSVPERRQFEILKAELEQCKLDKDKAEKKTAAAQKDLDYMREIHQDSSNRARELNAEKADLEQKLMVASARAEGEASRVRQISQDTRHQQLERKNKKLELILKERDAVIKLKDEEIAKLRDATRGRIGTRQSSVPRSPRVGSPIKGRAVGPGSRQGSPASGDVRGGGGGFRGHPLRRAD